MRRILIALCGNTPQVITETLYALHVQGRFPSRVIILTTEAGRRQCLVHLIHPECGYVPRLLSYLGRMEGNQLCCEEDIISPRSPTGQPIMDIRTEEDSRNFFELCFKTVFELACDHESELLFSIAGGRKTMSAALALAAQCYARTQDSMFHILVPPAYESDPHFFYPTSEDHEHITLTPIPFFRMRTQLPPELLQSPASLEGLAHVCMPLKPLLLLVDLSQRSLSCEGSTIFLPPSLFAIYAFFAMRERPCPESVKICPPDCGRCAVSWADIVPYRSEIVRLYELVETRAMARGGNGILHLSAENFRSSLAKLKKLLMHHFGESTGSRLSLVSIKQGKTAEYYLRIPKIQISIVTRQICSCEIPD